MAQLLNGFIIELPHWPAIYKFSGSINSIAQYIGNCQIFMNEPFLKKDKSQYANGYCSICYIKYGLKENEITASEIRHPFWQSRFKYGEVKHVHNFSLQELAIAMPEFRDVGYRILIVILQHIVQVIVVPGKTGVRAVSKYQTVKKAVHQVSHCPSQDE